jgi:hypothetical protein
VIGRQYRVGDEVKQSMYSAYAKLEGPVRPWDHGTVVAISEFGRWPIIVEFPNGNQPYRFSARELELVKGVEETWNS